MKASEILLDESIPHGTRDGYAAGCRGSHCPAKESLGMSCSQASIRYASDWSYKRRVDAGMSAEAIAADDKLEGYVAPKTSAREQRRFVATTPTVTVADSVERVHVREPEPVVEVPVERPAKWSVRRVWVAFAPDGRMHGPFDSQPQAMEVVREQWRPQPVGSFIEPVPIEVANEERAGKRVWLRWTDERVAEVRQLHADGLSDSAIARAVGRAPGSISQKLRDLGLPANGLRPKVAS